MNRLLDKLERKFGCFAVPHLTAVIIGCYVVGYMLELINPSAVAYMTLEPAYILSGQVWRLLTWIVIPPSSLNIFTIIMLFFYFSIGTSLERAWGNFRYNVYIFGGFLITVVTAFLCYFVCSGLYGEPVAFGILVSPFSTYYVCMSIFLAFAATFPDVRVMLYFVIPLKVKWLGVLYAAFLAYDVYSYARWIAAGYTAYWIYIIALLASLLNFLIFFLATRKGSRRTRADRQRQRQFRRNMETARRAQEQRMGVSAGTANSAQGVRHRCCICGRTDVSNPEMEFRVCSKCSGMREYCMEHLYTHEHV